ncbi:MAG TPA: ATP-binding cassette domain-containing protein [Agromyces sp.]|nr:ATP-binding cassette domain-containing protein [Agromyces sp.]
MPPSKRTAASRAASADAASARGEAAKTTRAKRSSVGKGTTGTPATRSRAAAAATAQHHAQRVAASLITETTEAERTPRKPPTESLAAAISEPPVAAERPGGRDEGRSEIDEETRERPTYRPPVIATPIAETEQAVAAASIAADAVVSDAAVSDAVVSDAVVSDTPVAETSEAEASDAEAPAVAGTAATEVVPEVAGPEEPELVASGTPAEASDTAQQAVAVIPVPKKAASRKKRTLRVARAAPPADAPRVLAIQGLVKRFGENTAVDGVSLDVRAGSFFGIVGPNGAGKTTTLSMVTGLLRPDAGSVHINGIDAWADRRAAKRATGVLPDRLRLFDRLTGAQLLYYSGVLRGLDSRTVRERSADLIAAFGLDDAVDRLVADYSAGMTKKIALACAMIHSPRLLVLDEPFESVDPVSAANLTEILERYVAGGGTVVLSSHGMDLIERVCDSAAIIVAGRVLAAGTLDEVRAGQTLEDRFVELAGGRKAAEGMEWLHSFSD